MKTESFSDSDPTQQGLRCRRRTKVDEIYAEFHVVFPCNRSPSPISRIPGNNPVGVRVVRDSRFFHPLAASRLSELLERFTQRAA